LQIALFLLVFRQERIETMADQESTTTQERTVTDNTTVEPQTLDQLPEWAQKLVKELRKENASNRNEKKTAEEAAKLAEEKRLMEQQEWQKLAEQRQSQLSDFEAKLKTFETKEQELERYKETLKGYVKAQRKSVPEHIGQLLDALDLAGQLEWLSKNADKLNSVSGVPATQKANGTLSDAQRQEAVNGAARFYRNQL
jgi:DNA repair exonuclease SbcCD ATPase subunit